MKATIQEFRLHAVEAVGKVDARLMTAEAQIQAIAKAMQAASTSDPLQKDDPWSGILGSGPGVGGASTTTAGGGPTTRQETRHGRDSATYEKGSRIFNGQTEGAHYLVFGAHLKKEVTIAFLQYWG